LLSHRLELLTQWEWKLSDDEARENGTNSCEEHDVEHTLDVAFDHIGHHVWVLKHSHLVELYFLIKVPSLWHAEVCFPLFDTVFR
jgi:hypothetical protein